MSSSSRKESPETAEHQEGSMLMKKLVDVFKEIIPHKRHLEVLGLLSYTTDNSTEKFLKIDFSSNIVDRNANEATSGAKKEETTHLSGGAEPAASARLGCVEDISLDKDPVNSASPPLLPPSFIHQSRSTRFVLGSDGRTESENATRFCTDNKNLGSLIEHSRRDRRKSRRPKRQIFSSDPPASDSEFDETNMEPDEPIFSASLSKKTRLDECLDVPPQSKLATPKESGSVAASASSTSGHIFPTSLSVPSSSETTLTKCLSTPVTSLDLATASNLSQVPASKYAVSAKSLSLSELGELCGILPLSSLLNRNLLSGGDSSLLAAKLNSNSTSVNGPIVLTTSEALAQLCPNGLINSQSPTIVATSSGGQSLFLNPNIAAAVAAALSASSVNVPIVANHPHSENSLSASIQTLTTPSIALTGPSGEILGTIPLGSAATTHTVTCPTITVTNAQATVTSSTANSTGSLLHQNSISSSSNISSTLNWLRCAAAPNEVPSQQLLSTATSLPSVCHSFGAANPVALLQSLTSQPHVGQQTCNSGQAKQPTLSSISVGPTLALIGTLGLNGAPAMTTSSISTNELTPVSATSASTLLTTNVIQNSTGSSQHSSNAALVAAALLRGLATAKQVNNESGEISTPEGNIQNLPGSLTLIANSLGSCANTSSRSSVVTAEGTLSSLSSILAAKSISTNLPPATHNSNQANDCLVSSGSVTLNRANLATQLLNGVSHGTARGPIMLSYPRGSGEMNLLLTPASTHAFTPSSLASMTALPAALSFQGLNNSQSNGVALTSPVLLHAAVTCSSIPTATTIVSATPTTATSTASLTPSTELPVSEKNCKPAVFSISTTSSKCVLSDSQQNSHLSDPTASAIDRILQTIRGCMNSSENRENETKIKIHTNASKKTDGIKLSNSDFHSSPACDVIANGTNDDSRKTFSVKLAPVTLCLSRNALGVTDFDPLSKQNDSSRNSSCSNERLPLAPLTKEAGDSDSQVSGSINKVYRCRYCGKTFNRKFCRERHERLHTGVKPYTCEICDEKFIRLEDKKRHVRSLQHFMAGRGGYVKEESAASIGEENHALKIEPSSVLPLLAHTLQAGVDENIDGSYGELEDRVGESDVTSNDHGSECDSFVGDGSPEKDIAASGASPSLLEVRSIRNVCSEDDFTETAPEDVSASKPFGDDQEDPALQAEAQHNLRNRCRSALKETQSKSNATSSPLRDTLSKLSTSVITASDEGFSSTLSSD
ncbi:unnamed protein product [Calicophoron daubneyi]|uniref:C2H2-type domain-containing protein n=1 Tax=Calicophoron daubneyi TaxID=300641 RepID=A0AAV2TSN1_CALDB